MMMPRVGLVRRLVSGAREARKSGARKNGLRKWAVWVSLALVAMAAMVGLSGCYWG